MWLIAYCFLNVTLLTLFVCFQHPGGGTELSRLSRSRLRLKLRSVPPIRAVLQLATVGAVLRVTARLSRAVTVMSPATTSAPAVMTSPRLAATVRAH